MLSQPPPYAELPPTHRALYLKSQSEAPTIETLPTPQPTPGSAVVRILTANVLSYARDIYNGKRSYNYATPLVPGVSAIARIAAVGPDATTLSPGDLVLIDVTIRGRDDPSAVFLLGISEGHSVGSRKLMHGEWRNGTYAEYAKIPLENCIPLPSPLLATTEEGGLGYTIEDLAHIPKLLVPFGGLRDIDIKVGETVVVSPATGAFGGAAVQVAVAMGARVIAMGRDSTKLSALKDRFKRSQVETVTMSGDVETDTAALRAFGPSDAFFDISPPAAAGSTHIKSGILALRHGGRVSLMGGIRDDVSIPHSTVMHGNLRIQGKWMYEREDIFALLKLVQRGNLKLTEGAGMVTVGAFPLEEWEKAFDLAAQKAGMGEMVLIMP
ncbi:GroES-like protein [Glonium stellatum]|uniref:GroES-like protein n=1 Tax=Glonium stellatum TaxID=574774 RepID=A0A8E2EPK2_9PEZI|nr:GroES-like protein [Glonium stellatum]